MADHDVEELRLFCICGQKMKVSGEMFGRPGRCVACRQRIRIPRIDEVPDPEADIYLKDHPEFLRKATNKKSKSKPQKPGQNKPSKQRDREIVLKPEGGKPAESAAPINVLESLRLLVSLEEKIDAKLAELKKSGTAVDRAEWEGHQTKLHAARTELDEQLRQRLMEVSIELSNMDSRIGEVGLAVRVGELDYGAFREQIAKLRQRRDRLERRQLNLRGWLATHDSSIAGGYLDASPAAIPTASTQLSFPNEPDDTAPPLQIYLEELRTALETKERAQRKIKESEKLASEGNLPKHSLSKIRGEQKGIAKRAQSAASFFRGRLRQLMTDFDNDLKAANAQVDLARSRLKVGEIDRGQFERIEKDLLRVRNDMAKARALIRRGLSADTARAVPPPTGTFLNRMAKPGASDRVTPDVGMACASALLFLVTIVLPAIDGNSPIAAFRQQPDTSQHWVISGPITITILTLISAAIPMQLLRGAALAGLASFGTIIAAYFINAQSSATTRMAEMFRASDPISLGSLVFWIAMIVLTGAAGYALWRNNRQRILFAGIMAPAVIATPFLLMNAGGIDRIQPAIGMATAKPVADGSGLMEVNIDVRNVGGKTFTVGVEPNNDAQADFMLEWNEGPTTWKPVEAPVRVTAGNREQPYTRQIGRSIAIAPGGTTTITYNLAPEEYRVVLRGPAVQPAIIETFTVAPPAIEAPQPADIDETGAMESSESEASDSEMAERENGPEPAAERNEERRTTGVSAELKGQIRVGDDPQFRVELTFPNGNVSSRMLLLRDELYDGWVLEEFNRRDQALVLSRDGDILVLRTGEILDL